MNLAIEYMIRTGIVKEAIEIPCSLYVTHVQDNELHKALIIAWNDFKQCYTVKHWNVSSCKEEDVLPSFVEHEVSKDELFYSEYIIDPHYNILDFHTDTYRTRRQYADSRSHIQEEDYNNFLDSYCNPFAHKHARIKLLWDCFKKAHVRKLKWLLSNHPIDLQQYYIEKQFPKVWKYWLMWVRYLTCNEKIAPELVFFEEYNKIHKSKTKKITKDKKIKVNRRWLNGNWHSTDDWDIYLINPSTPIVHRSSTSNNTIILRDHG